VTATLPTSLLALRERFEDALTAFLDDVRAEIAAEQPEATLPLDEIRRLLAAGGKRLRPGFCYWGHRAAGGADGEAIVRAGAALELLHTMALIHDDLMDGSAERRGVPSSATELAAFEADRLYGLAFDDGSKTLFVGSTSDIQGSLDLYRNDVVVGSVDLDGVPYQYAFVGD